jgi:uncharacterized protein YqiB (DUF1249 family)
VFLDKRKTTVLKITQNTSYTKLLKIFLRTPPLGFIPYPVLIDTIFCEKVLKTVTIIGPLTLIHVDVCHDYTVEDETHFLILCDR